MVENILGNKRRATKVVCLPGRRDVFVSFEVMLTIEMFLLFDTFDRPSMVVFQLEIACKSDRYFLYFKYLNLFDKFQK